MAAGVNRAVRPGNPDRGRRPFLLMGGNSRGHPSLSAPWAPAGGGRTVARSRAARDGSDGRLLLLHGIGVEGPSRLAEVRCGKRPAFPARVARRGTVGTPA